MRINLRVDSINDSHVHCTLFMNGALCGKLCFQIGEYQLFGAIISLGCKQTNDQHINRSDDQVFTEWIEKTMIENKEEGK